MTDRVHRASDRAWRTPHVAMVSADEQPTIAMSPVAWLLRAGAPPGLILDTQIQAEREGDLESVVAALPDDVVFDAVGAWAGEARGRRAGSTRGGWQR